MISMIWKLATFLLGVIVTLILLFVITVFIFTAYQQYMKHRINISEKSISPKNLKELKEAMSDPSNDYYMDGNNNLIVERKKDGGNNGTKKDR